MNNNSLLFEYNFGKELGCRSFQLRVVLREDGKTRGLNEKSLVVKIMPVSLLSVQFKNSNLSAGVGIYFADHINFCGSTTVGNRDT